MRPAYIELFVELQFVLVHEVDEFFGAEYSHDFIALVDDAVAVEERRFLEDLVQTEATIEAKMQPTAQMSIEKS